MALLERVPQLAPAATSSAEAPAPIAPVAIEETGLTQAFIADLVLKILYQKGQATAAELADVICLPLPKILQGILEFLKTEHFVEVKGSSGMAAATYVYVIATKGQERAREAFAKNGYVGAAPVTLAAYVNRVRAQTIGSLQVTFDEIRKALTHLVLPEKTLRQLGPAINSGRSIFLFGPPGTGKSSIAETLARDVDFLTLSDGRKIEVPFDVLLVFATNRTPSSLVDEAFLRRIQYKIEVKPPTEQEFSEIVRRVCETQKITFYPKAAEWIAAYARERNIPLRSCHPRDLMQHLGAASRFLLKPAELTPELVELACETYFVPI